MQLELITIQVNREFSPFRALMAAQLNAATGDGPTTATPSLTPPEREALIKSPPQL